MGEEEIKIYVFDHDIIAAHSAEEARQHLIETGDLEDDCDADDCWPEAELSLDTPVFVDKQELDLCYEGEVECECPRCGHAFVKTTWRMLLKGITEFPAIVGGRD